MRHLTHFRQKNVLGNRPRERPGGPWSHRKCFLGGPGASWSLPATSGRCPSDLRGTPEAAQSLQAPPQECPRPPKGPKGHGRSAPGSLGLALLGRQRAAGLVSDAFAEIDVFLCKFNGFGGFGHSRIVAGGTGQRRFRQSRGLASSLWGLWLTGPGSWGALGHWAGRPWGSLGQNNFKGSFRALVDPKAPGEVFVYIYIYIST